MSYLVFLSNRLIQLNNAILKHITPLGHRTPESNDNQWVLHLTQISTTGAIPYDAV